MYLADWLHNLQARLTEIRIHTEGENAWLIEGHSFKRIQIKPDLAKALKEKTGKDPIKVHSGFLKYLFASQGRNDETKYRVIVNNLKNLTGHPKFKRESELTITGHSLGGALTTLLSFFLACDMLITDGVLKYSRDHVRKYISCVSYASPLVGDKGFQKAFAVLEEENRLKHVRITNSRDPVPLSPPLPSYRHTGVQVHLRGKNWLGKEAVVKDTGVVEKSKSAMWPFIGFVLTTFPPVILFPLYFLLCNIPFFLALGALISMILSLKVKNKFVVIMREKVVPLGAIAGIVCLTYYYSQVKEVTPQISALTLDGWHAYIVGFIFLSQAIMFVRQPQHVFDSECRAKKFYKDGTPVKTEKLDENGKEELDEHGKPVMVDPQLGRTHSLSHYYYNLQEALGAEYKLSSSKDVWEQNTKRA